MSGGRPAGPLRRYTISCAWPSSPERFRVTVGSVDEKTAKESAYALSRMRHSVRIEMSFHKAGPSRELEGECLAAQWKPDGLVHMRHTGKFKDYIPAWATGGKPAEKGKSSDSAALSSS